MFTIYHSNQVDLLESLVSELIRRDPLSDIFMPEVILVQSQGMAQWLQIALANDLNIAANIAFPFPNQFIQQLSQLLLPNAPITDNMESMTWQIFSLLPTLLDRPEFRPLNHYINGESSNSVSVNSKSIDNKFIDSKNNSDEIKQIRIYQLAVRIARLFDQYLVYRPDWIAEWEAGERVPALNRHTAEQWQAELWREIIKSNAQYHRNSLYKQMSAKLADPNFDPSCLKTLPNRIFIFGIVSLPPIYLELLYALGQHIDIHLMFNNPCRWYWGDIIEKQLTAVEGADKIPNPLLTSWGKLGRDNLFLLQDFDNKRDIELFADYESTNLLHTIQQDILDLYRDEAQKRTVSVDDNSISFHICHSEQREVEVLHDYLLSLFDHNPDLELRDCVVMVSDIDRYVPYIQAVFGNSDAFANSSRRYLPYTISDQKARTIDPIVQGFFAILDFPDSRFTTEDLFNLLEIPAIAEKFAITESQLTLLRTWIIESGIRFGLADAHSWLFGLERLLLGYLIDSEQGIWQQILPYNGATGLDAELIGQLAEFLTTVRRWFTILSEPKSAAEWQDYCAQLCDDFFVATDQNEAIFQLIKEEWQKLLTAANVIDEPISIAILLSAMQSRLEDRQLAHNFLTGKINFCTMMPMRSIPFKVVCLLGMNDGTYPRTLLPLDFDLIAFHSRRGDRSRRNDDRYLFLEAILAAQERLYISYIGRDIKDNSERYPSVLVDELWEYIAQNYTVCQDQKSNIRSDKTDDNLATEKGTAFNFLKINHSRTPFNPENYLNDPKSYAAEWLPAAAKQGKLHPFIADLPPTVIDKIDIDDLKRFYRHSIRYFLQHRLHYYLDHLDETLPDSENFTLDDLKRYQLNRSILQQLIEPTVTDYALSLSLDEKRAALYKRLQLSGELPDGAFGEIIYDKQFELMQQLADRVNQERQTQTVQEVNLTLTFTALTDANSTNPLTVQSCQLQGWLSGVQADGILQWKPSKLSIYDGMSLWIDHLIYTQLNPDKSLHQSRIYGRDESEWRFFKIDAAEATALLTTLVTGYLQGVNQPLLFPLQAAWQWLNSAYSEETGNIEESPKADAKLVNSWQDGFKQSSFNKISECDEYYNRLYPVLTPELVKQITSAAARFLLPILRHQKAYKGVTL
ncbi:exodeoxyribonuclease V subunit gamma [Orbaceae bacterium ESL0721]|nr:exodeoxyribonuclease V subunit gamma [Orbaceae bacterium ESL0721]